MGKRLKDSWAECAYCGQRAVHRDHVLPVCWTHRTARRLLDPSYDESEVVPACQECNSLLSGMFLPTVAQRADYLAAKLATRHRKLLSSGVWTEEQIAELKGNLRSFVKARQQQRLEMLDRIRNCIFVASLPSLELSDIWAAHHKGQTLAEYISSNNLIAEKSKGESARQTETQKTDTEIGKERLERFLVVLEEMVRQGHSWTTAEVENAAQLPYRWIKTKSKCFKLYQEAIKKAESKNPCDNNVEVNP